MVQKQLSTTIISMLADAKEQERYSQFGSDVSETTRGIIDMGRILRFMLNQNEVQHMPVDVQAVLLSLVLTSFTNGKNVTFIRKNYEKINEVVTSEAFADVRSAVFKEVEFDTFIATVEKHVKYIDEVCQQ
jgi:F0F1-type ATP synthase alpha subunit